MFVIVGHKFNFIEWFLSNYLNWMGLGLFDLLAEIGRFNFLLLQTLNIPLVFGGVEDRQFIDDALVAPTEDNDEILDGHRAVTMARARKRPRLILHLLPYQQRAAAETGALLLLLL